MQELKVKGFIVRVVRTQEADVIVKILTAQGEKISAYARSALKSRKRFEGGLTALTQIEFRAHKKTNQEIFILEDAKVTYEFLNLPSSIEALTMASYFAELSESCAHEGLENENLYNLLGASLKILDNGKSPWLVAPVFEVKLLSLMGWLPDFSEMDEKSATILRHILSQRVSDFTLTPTEAQSVDPVLKSLVRAHLGEGKIKSLDFFKGLRRFQEQQMMSHPKHQSHNDHKTDK